MQPDLCHALYGVNGNVNADPAPAQGMGGFQGGGTATKRVKDDIAGVGTGRDDAVEQGEQLLGRVAEAFTAKGCWNIRP